ncbi:predicted protein [Nematostella vectensis]|uniref:GIY-YIG domain-containing protein n=1 Tax=Nematostella vectensis TaxID=45351 RepID=A7SIG9_NEMVE|nr:predicted protein [Nematostella vectensis]|eukprot:XP_001628594.1 predicted protein [Nematostella vectensis]
MGFIETKNCSIKMQSVEPEESFNNRCNELANYLLKRGYKPAFLKRQILRVANISRIDALRPNNNNHKNSRRIPFVTTYNPTLPNINNIIRRNYNLLLSSKRCHKVFTEPPLVAFRRSPNLRDILVKAKLPSDRSPTNQPPGAFRCGKNCLTCPFIRTDGLTSYTFFSTGETRPITSHITCNTKNVIYMIQCNRCNLQYIGETKRKLKERFNDHRRTVDSQSRSIPTHAAEHFLKPNHSASDIELIPIEKIRNNRDSIRKAREAKLIARAGTLEPGGLNRREETV